MQGWVDDLIERPPTFRFHGRLVGMCLLLTIADGFDLVAISFAAPALLKEWGLTPQALAPLFTLGLLGGLFGPPIFGFLADRVGRKPLIVGGTLFYGTCTLLSVWVGSLTELIILRFFAGFAISGVMPTIVALLSEYGGRRSRGTFTILGYCGVTVGGLTAGIVAARFLQPLGWEIMFWAGGLAPLVVGALAFFFLPESLRFLARKPGRRAQLETVAAQLGAQTVPEAMQVSEERPAPTRLRDVFSDGLGPITLLLWLTTFLTIATMFLLTQWTPVLLSERGASVETASLAAAFFQLGGLLGGLALMRPLDRFGYIVVALAYLCAIPFVAAIGISGVGPAQLMLLTALAGFFLNGLQFGNVAIQGQVYPTQIRSFGVGLCFMLGRLGSICGPALAGVLLAYQMSVENIFIVAAAGPAIAFLAALPLARLIKQRRAANLQAEPAPTTA